MQSLTLRALSAAEAEAGGKEIYCIPPMGSVNRNAQIGAPGRQEGARRRRPRKARRGRLCPTYANIAPDMNEGALRGTQYTGAPSALLLQFICHGYTGLVFRVLPHPENARTVLGAPLAYCKHHLFWDMASAGYNHSSTCTSHISRIRSVPVPAHAPRASRGYMHERIDPSTLPLRSDSLTRNGCLKKCIGHF